MKAYIVLLLAITFGSPESEAVESCLSSCQTLTNCAQDSRDALNETRHERANIKAKNSSAATQRNSKNLAKSKSSQTDPMKRAAESANDCQQVGADCANGLQGTLTKIKGIKDDLNHGLSQISNCMADKRFAPLAQNIQQEIEQMIQLARQEEAATTQELTRCKSAQSQCSALGATNDDNADKMDSEKDKKDGGGSGGGGAPPGGGQPEPKPEEKVDCGKPENSEKSACIAVFCSTPEFAGNPKCAAFCSKPKNKTKAGCMAPSIPTPAKQTPAKQTNMNINMNPTK